MLWLSELGVSCCDACRGRRCISKLVEPGIRTIRTHGKTHKKQQRGKKSEDKSEDNRTKIEQNPRESKLILSKCTRKHRKNGEWKGNRTKMNKNDGRKKIRKKALLETKGKARHKMGGKNVFQVGALRGQRNTEGARPGRDIPVIKSII